MLGGVVLPLPDLPRSTTYSSCSILRLALFNALKPPLPHSRTLHTPLNSIALSLWIVLAKSKTSRF